MVGVEQGNRSRYLGGLWATDTDRTRKADGNEPVGGLKTMISRAYCLDARENFCMLCFTSIWLEISFFYAVFPLLFSLIYCFSIAGWSKDGTLYHEDFI